jgi:hypothetical protein
VTVCAEEGRSHRRRRRCKSDDRRSTKRALSQKSEQLASTHVALLDSERREALLDHELAHQRNTHAKLNKQIKHLKNEVQKTEILLHEVLEGVWQKEVASQDTRAGAQDHNSAHEQAINKAADSIHGIGKLGMMFIFSFAVSWSLVLLDRQEYVEVPRLAKENRKNAHNPGTQTCVATEGRSVKSALSFLTLMCEVWQAVAACRIVSSCKTARKHASQRINKIMGASPYVAAKQLLDIIQEFPISLFVPCNHDLYIHSSLPEGHEHHGLLKYLPGKEGVWISSLTTIRQASPDKDTWIFDTQMPLHPIMVQSQDVWQDVPDGLNRHSAQGGAATGQSQVAIIRCRSSWDCTE